MPGKGEGIAFLLDSCRSLLRFSGPQGSRSTQAEVSSVDPCDAGSASTPAQPALDGSVPCSFLDCGHAEAQVEVPALRRVPAAVRRAAAPGVVAPATAPDDPGRGLGRARRIGRRRRGVVFLIIPIGAPFPDVADHIVKTPGIGREGTDRSGVDKTIVSLDAVPVRELLLGTRVGHVANLDEVFRIVADDKQGVRPSTASVFPSRSPVLLRISTPLAGERALCEVAKTATLAAHHSHSVDCKAERVRPGKCGNDTPIVSSASWCRLKTVTRYG